MLLSSQLLDGEQPEAAGASGWPQAAWVRQGPLEALRGDLSHSVRRKKVHLTGMQGHFRRSHVLGGQTFGDPVRSGTFSADLGGPQCTPGKETQLGLQAGGRLGAALPRVSSMSVGPEGDLTSCLTLACLSPATAPRTHML